MIKKLLPWIIVIGLLSGCRSLEWREVKEENSIISYRAFLKKYPAGRFSAKAREALETLAWERTRENGSVGAYDNFIKNYPESEFAGVALRLKDERALKNAEEKNTVEAYQNFVRRNPDSRHLKTAKRRLEELDWEEARKKDTVKGYSQFIESNRNSLYKTKADNRKEKLGLKKFEVVSFQEAEKENTLDSYRLFLEIYPRGVYAGKAVRKMIPLLPGQMGQRVSDLISKNSLSRARGLLALQKYKKSDILLITTLLINTLDDKTPIHPEGRVWEKSSTIGEEVKKIFRSIGEDAVSSLNFALLLGGYLNSRYSDEVRLRIVETLEAIGSRDAIGPLTDLLEIEDIDYKVKLEAIKALLHTFRDHNSEKLSADILKRLLSHRDERVRRGAVRKLQEIDSPAMIAPLLSALNDKNPRLHAEKIRILGTTGDRRAIKPLIAVLATDQRREARMMAAEGLISIGNREAIETFITLTGRDNQTSLRRKAVKGLVKLYNPETDPKLTSLFVTLSKDPDQYIRIKANEALQMAGLTSSSIPEN